MMMDVRCCDCGVNALQFVDRRAAMATPLPIMVDLSIMMNLYTVLWIRDVIFTACCLLIDIDGWHYVCFFACFRRQ